MGKSRRRSSDRVPQSDRLPPRNRVPPPGEDQVFKPAAVSFALRTLAICLGMFCLYALINQRSLFLNRWTAQAFAASLDLLGMEARVDDFTVTWDSGSGAQAFVIIEECTAIFGLWVFSAVVLATRVSWWWRVAGILGGGILIAIINQLRLLALALVKTFHPSWFRVAHDYLWQVAFVIGVAFVFQLWLTRTPHEMERMERLERLPP